MSKVRIAVVREGGCFRGATAYQFLKELRADYGVSAPERKLPKWKQAEWVVQELKKLGVRVRLRVWRTDKKKLHKGYVEFLQDYGAGRRIRRAGIPESVQPPAVTPPRSYRYTTSFLRTGQAPTITSTPATATGIWATTPQMVDYGRLEETLMNQLATPRPAPRRPNDPRNR